MTIVASVLLITGATMYIFDPYFHYHAPLPGVSYRLNNNVYQNDGISKNWDYETIVTGTSMTASISLEQVNETFETTSVKATFFGEGFRRINDNLDSAFAHNDNIKLVIRCVDPIWFVCDWGFLEYGSYDEYPTYLYDEDWTNDFSYLYNLDIIRDDLIPMIKSTIIGVPADTFDGQISHDKGSIKKVLEDYERGPKEIKEIDPAETEEMMANLERNIQKNLIRTINEHPDTKFIIYFPPYGSFFWDNLMQMGSEVVERRYDMEQYVIEELLKCDNVELYSFLDCFDITTDMNNYTDALHYTADISWYIIDTIGNTHEHKLTSDNYMDYLEKSKQFYLNYDYDAVFGNAG